MTCAILNLDGKVACWNDKFASRVMTGAKMPLHFLMSDVGRKSRGDDFDDIDLINLSTSAVVTGWKSDIDTPQNNWSDSSGSNCCPANADDIALLMIRTLFTKNTASDEQKELSSVSVVEVSWWPVCSRSLTADHTRRVSRPASVMR